MGVGGPMADSTEDGDALGGELILTGWNCPSHRAIRLNLDEEILVNQPWRSVITMEPDKRGGRPCIRGMRITVYDVLSYLAAGMTIAEILDDFPYLTAEDIQACFASAAERERSMLVAIA